MIEGNWESLTENQKELIREIASGLAELISEKVAKPLNIFYKIIKLKKTEENKLISALSQFVESENISETVLKNAKDVVGSLNVDTLLQYRCNHDGLKKKLFNSYCSGLQEKNEKEALYSLICYIVEACYRNIQDHVPSQKMVEQVLKNTDNLQQTAKEIKEDTQEIKEGIEELRRKKPPSGNVPVSHNSIYEKKFTAPFFLEKEMPEKKFCSLNNVFVEPVLTEDKDSGLEEKLQNWVSDYDESSGEWNDAMYSVFLLYGKAGVGKSSYTAKLIEKQLFGKNWLALELRSCADRLKSADAWESVKAIFFTDDDKAYKDSILILDGLDEVCVLYPDFDGRVFIENLQAETALKTNNIKILITSREGYFGNITQKNNLLTDTIQWTEEQVGEWCKAYCMVHKSRIAWAEKFMADYHKLPGGDDRRDIFCIPIILYLCCVREIDIGNESTVVGIYEKAFRAVGERKHNPTNDTEMQEDDERTFAVNWQYTKELAYRIFLNGKSPTVLENDGIQDAKAHTKERFENCEPALDRYFALFPFASKKKEEGKPEGMEFAHKTVTDYFIAVKLYEDYFAAIFDEPDKDHTQTLWQGLWRAFRYKEMPDDIMGYLVQVIENRQGKDYDAYRMKFFDCYYEGVKKQTVWQILNEPEYACEMEYDQLPQQVGLVFRNLTYLLWCLNYAKFEKEPEQAYTDVVSTFFRCGVIMDVRCIFWRGLRGADLHGADLSEAHLWGADLRGADLRNANLRSANLHSANLCSADLYRADLRNVYLGVADLSVANLRGADLRGANLCGADLWDVTWSENQALTNIRLCDTDLPLLDEAIKNYKIRLMNPVVYRGETEEILEYNPETNRAEEPLFP